MSTKTRYFVIASLLVLSVGLGTGLVAYYSGLNLGALAQDSGPEDLRFLPSDASVVAYAEVGQIMASPLRQKLRVFVPNADGQQEFQNHTGINIDSDIDRVLAAIVPARGTSPDQHGTGLVIARGRFDQVKIESLMREHGATVEDYKNQRVILAPAKDAENGFAVTFLEPGLLGVGSPILVRNAVDLKTGGASVMTNEDLMARIRNLNGGNAWAVGHFAALAHQARLPQEFAQNLPSVSWISGSALIDSGLRATVTAETKDEAAANSLRDIVRGFVALAKLQTTGRPEIETFMQTLTLGGSGNVVTLSFDAPAELFDAVHNAAQSPGPQALAR